MERQGQREQRDIYLQWHNSVSFLHLSQPGKSLGFCTRVRKHSHAHAHTETHMNMYATVSLAFGSVAAAAAGQVVIDSKYTSSSAQLTLSHWSSNRHQNNKCTAKNLLSWGRLCQLTSCTVTAPVNVWILTIFGHSSKSDSNQVPRRA